MHYFCPWKGTSSLIDWLWQKGKIVSSRCITKRHKMYLNTSVYYDITGTIRICQMSVCCRYLQASVTLDQSLRNNAERSDLACEFRMFTVQRNLDWFANPWLFRKELRRMLRVQFRILGSSSSLGHRLSACSPGPLYAMHLLVSHTSPLPLSEGSLPGYKWSKAVLSLLVPVWHNEQWSSNLCWAVQAVQVILLIFTNHNNQSLSHKSRAVKASAPVNAASQLVFTFIPIVFCEEPPSWLPAWHMQAIKLFCKSEWHVHKGD